MRLTLSTPRTGLAYFPGLAAPRTLDVASLPAALAREIESCVKEVAVEAQTDGPADMDRLRDDVLHSVVVEQPDGQVQRFEGPPTAAMGRLVTAFRAGLRAEAERESKTSS